MNWTFRRPQSPREKHRERGRLGAAAAAAPVHPDVPPSVPPHLRDLARAFVEAGRANLGRAVDAPDTPEQARRRQLAAARAADAIARWQARRAVAAQGGEPEPAAPPVTAPAAPARAPERPEDRGAGNAPEPRPEDQGDAPEREPPPPLPGPPTAAGGGDRFIPEPISKPTSA
jgi:hypothetical protein